MRDNNTPTKRKAFIIIIFLVTFIFVLYFDQVTSLLPTITSTEVLKSQDEPNESYDYNEKLDNDINININEEQEKPKPLYLLPTVILPSKHSNITSNLKLVSENPNYNNLQTKLTHGIHLIVSFYKGDYEKDRFDEIITTLKQNLRNHYITAVHTLWEDYDPIQFLHFTSNHSQIYLNKLIRVYFGTQPTYKDLFDYSNLYLSRGTVAIITNSDIYFTNSLSCVKPVSFNQLAFNSTKQHLVYALSRHPSQPCLNRVDYCLEYTGSHDAFVFAPPVPFKFAGKLDFFQNRKGAENIVIWEFRNMNGYRIVNPCRSIKCFHNHCTNQRNYPSVTISRGKYRIGNIDRHASIIASDIRCGQVIY
jgi:hypothetical protein